MRWGPIGPTMNWRLWLAWYPVKAMNHEWIWLEWVERIDYMSPEIPIGVPLNGFSTAFVVRGLYDNYRPRY